MDLILALIDFVLHVDRHLASLVREYGFYTHLILFAIVFMETGLVVTPFLPGDSLLFVAGALAAMGNMDLFILIALLIAAAVLGDTVNYWAGKWAGPEIFRKDTGRFLKKDHLLKAHEFYERHGGKAIVLARFVPIVRTFAPFVAGIGRMTYSHFLAYNVIGGVAWVLMFVLGGYFFGNLPVVKSRFHLVVAAIIIISVMPMVVEWIRYKLAAKNQKT